MLFNDCGDNVKKKNNEQRAGNTLVKHGMRCNSIATGMG